MRWTKAISKEWQLYPVGVVFGLGFDTATEVALLATTALLASQHVPWYAILCLPVLFTAGMTVMDTTDGPFINLAYGWAFFNPVRKVYYNLAITGLSVAICFFVAGIEVLGLLPQGSAGSAGAPASGASCTTSTSTPPGSSSWACSSSPGWLRCSSGASAGSKNDGPPDRSPPRRGTTNPDHTGTRTRGTATTALHHPQSQSFGSGGAIIRRCRGCRPTRASRRYTTTQITQFGYDLGRHSDNRTAVHNGGSVRDVEIEHRSH
jgi:hypothetical protein